MNYKLLLAIASVFSILACSSNDDSNNNSSNPTQYLSLSLQNYWTYDVESQFNGRDSLYISNDTIINANMYKKFKTLQEPFGFYSSALRENALRKIEDKIALSGAVNLTNNPIIPLDLNIPILDFIMFDEDASENTVLDTENGTTQQTINSFPLNINYTLTSKAGQSYPNYTSPNGDSYTNVKAVKIILNASATTTYQGINLTVLNAQDVLVSTLYFAKDIGVVHINTDTSYSLNSFIAQEFGLPASNSQNSKEFLYTYLINN